MIHHEVAPAAPGAAPTVQVPGDKSISHRALLLNALALRASGGSAVVRGLLESEDVMCTRVACGRMGVDAVRDGALWRLARTGPARGGAVDCGNSGTTARLLLGALAGLTGPDGAPEPEPYALHGDASLSRRPMRRVLGPLTAMGARVTPDGAATLPLNVHPAPLRGIDHTSPIASAQVKSAVLLAGLGAEGPTRYREPEPSRDHTERFFRAMGARLGTDGAALVLQPGPLAPVDVIVPGDISSAAFWMVAACIVPGARVRLPGVGVNPTRTGSIDVLRAMGARIDVAEHAGVEPLADLEVAADGLRGTSVRGALIPRLIDEIPVLAVAAAFADGETVFADAAELRVKESDRIDAVVTGLRAIGAEAEATSDGLRVQGRGGAGLHAAVIESRGDHRIAMAFAIAGLRLGMRLEDVGCVATSYPSFFTHLAAFPASGTR